MHGNYTGVIGTGSYHTILLFNSDVESYAPSGGYGIDPGSNRMDIDLFRSNTISSIDWTQFDATGSQWEDNLFDLKTDRLSGSVLLADAIADLNQTISDPPTQAEVQAISDKVDAILAAARTSGWLAT